MFKDYSLAILKLAKKTQKNPDGTIEKEAFYEAVGRTFGLERPLITMFMNGLWGDNYVEPIDNGEAFRITVKAYKRIHIGFKTVGIALFTNVFAPIAVAIIVSIITNVVIQCI